MSRLLKHLPLPVEGCVSGDAVLLTFGAPGNPNAIRLLWPGTTEQAVDLVRALNSFPGLVKALLAARDDCRDTDTDAALSPATGTLIEEALAAAGVRP